MNTINLSPPEEPGMTLAIGSLTPSEAYLEHLFFVGSIKAFFQSLLLLLSTQKSRKSNDSHGFRNTKNELNTHFHFTTEDGI